MFKRFWLIKGKMVSKTKQEFGDWVPLQTQNMGELWIIIFGDAQKGLVGGMDTVTHQHHSITGQLPRTPYSLKWQKQEIFLTVLTKFI